MRLTDFGVLPAPYNYIAMIPQWDLLSLLAQEARREPSFTLRMNTAATGLIREGGKVAGVRYRTQGGEEGEIRAALTVAADGRHSALRQDAGLVPQEFPVPFDTWWFRLPRLVPAFRAGEFALSITRNDYFQIAYFTTKGSDARLRTEGIERFRARIAGRMTRYADRVDQLPGMDVHLLDVRPTGFRTGTPTASCASATPPTRCRRPAEWGSTSPSRTRSPRPRSSPNRCAWAG
ncbi:FAD-dependent monooxygenase [Streptomyces sp. NPDC094438]|uniref:FAD-dependent monooxygenase n=1 Tax=Streptomyces sp. NPDC094438 TaxID=3366061 RepID=UPI0037FD533E